MSEIYIKAWWCTYCVHCIDTKCVKDVPYYCSSPSCKYYEESTEPKKPVKHRLKWYKKHVLVDTI